MNRFSTDRLTAEKLDESHLADLVSLHHVSTRSDAMIGLASLYPSYGLETVSRSLSYLRIPASSAATSVTSFSWTGSTLAALDRPNRCWKRGIFPHFSSPHEKGPRRMPGA
jgi:hypothetical protein